MARYKSDKNRSKIRISAAIEKHRLEYQKMKSQCPFNADRKASFNPEEYGKRVQERRNLLNKTQSVIAKEAGMSTAMLSKIEGGGIKEINQDYLYLLSVVLECTADYLLGRATAPEGFVGIPGKEGNQTDGSKAISPIKFEEKPVCELSLSIMQGVTLAAARKAYNEIPETVFQLIAILRSENPKLISEFSKCVDLLCSSHNVKVDYFRRSAN